MTCSRTSRIRSTGIGLADRRGDGDPGDPVARGRVVGGAQADRQGQRQFGHRHAQRLVVAPQTAAQRGQVRVVDRTARRLGRRAQVSQRHLQHVGAADQAAPAQQRRLRDRRRAEHPLGRDSEADRLRHRGPRRPDQPAGVTRRPTQQPNPGRQGRLGQPAQAVAQQVAAGHVAGDGHGRHGPRGRVPLGVVDLLEQGDPAQPVGDRVAELGQQRRPAALQALHVDRLPQRARGVQRRLQRDLGQVEQLAQRARRGQGDPAQVVVQVEVGIDDPPRRGGRQRRDHDLLPHPDHHPAGPVHRLAQPAPVGGLVQELHAEERRPGGRVRLAPVQQVIQRTELVGLPKRQWRMGHYVIIVFPWNDSSGAAGRLR